ncbi:MAG: ASCH domain-containing protein [Tissierellia bacterium]|nr:ASCH domain-containing protein [Tissierellia bacterium]
MYGLFMIEPYGSLILDGFKSYDARSYSTNIRGKIAIIDSKTHLIKGYVTLTDVKEISFKEYVVWHNDAYKDFEIVNNQPSKKYYAWILEKPIKENKKIKVQRLSRNPWINLEGLNENA